MRPGKTLLPCGIGFLVTACGFLACAELYRAFAAPLANRVRLPRLADRDLVDDALAEPFRMFLERLGDYQARGGGVWSWLATIAANKGQRRLPRSDPGWSRLV